jgi:hypothetical protein
LHRRRFFAPGGLAAIAIAGCASASKTALIAQNTAAPDASSSVPDAALDEGGVQPDDASASTDAVTIANRDDAGTPIDLAVSDEAPYAPGQRPRRGGSVAASAEDETIAKWNRGGVVAGETPPTPAGRVPHLAPRIKVDVLKVKGHISESDVLREARSKGYWPFRLCYEEGLRRSQKLHGTVQVRMAVGANGAVRSAQKVAAEVEDPTVVGCVVKAAKSLALPAPERGTPSVTLEVSLWPGDDAVQTSSAPDGKKTRALDVTELVAALRAHLPEVRACFAEGRKNHAGLWGRIAIRLRIRAAGEIVDATEIESRFPDPAVTFCVLKTFAHTDVPAPREELIIVYPLRLGSTDPHGGAP